MMEAFRRLDSKLDRPVRLIVGGGGAMLLAHHFPLTTHDIDAVPTMGMTLSELKTPIEAVAAELSLAPDWLNPFYSSFAHVLPSEYGSRLIDICQLKWLRVSALSKEDLLIMKCFAARQKDVVHARALVKQGADISIVRKQFNSLKQKKIPGTERAEKFLSEIEAFFEDKSE